MGAKVFRSNHLHAEISQLEGHLDTGFVAVEHRNSLSRGSDMLGLRAERAADRASRADLGEECDSTSNRQTPHRTHDDEGRRTCTHQRERVRPMSGAPTTPIKRQPTGRACDLSREFCDVDIGLGVGDNEATDTQRPLAAQTRPATAWSPLITTNIGPPTVSRR